MIAPTISPSMTLLSYYELVYKPRRLTGRAAESDKQYRINIRHFDTYLGRPALLSDLDDDVVAAALGWVVDRGRAPATANKFRNHVLAMWRYASNKRHVPEGPDVRPLKEYKREPTAWTPEQFCRLLATTKVYFTAKRRIGGVPASIWWHCLLLVIYDTGGRIGAVLASRFDDFDPESKRLMLRAETQKQGEDQLQGLSEQTTRALLESVQALPRDLLFPWPYCKANLYFALQQLLKAAGLPHSRRDKFHRIRRTSATMAEIHAGEGTARRHLGHSSAKVTARYIATSMLPDQNVAAKLPRPNVETPVDEWSQPIAHDELLLVLVAEFAQWLEEIGCSHKYVLEVRKPVRKLIKEMGLKLASDLDAKRIRDYLTGRVQNGLSPRTAFNYRKYVVRFLRYLVLERGMHGSVMTALAGLRGELDGAS